MTPDSIKKAVVTLANGVGNFRDARSDGEALGRALAAEIRARGVASQQMNSAVALDMELELLTLASGSDEFVAEVADSALKSLRAQQQKPG